MNDRAAQDHLQPSLLDRLTDDEPDKQVESRDKRVISLGRLKECVLRDLGWLLNTTSLPESVDTEGLDHVRDSVLNYGIPELAGATASSLDASGMEKAIRQAIWDFEPRILRKSVKVHVNVDNKASMNHNAVKFRIEGELYAKPAPMRVAMRTEIDLENGNIQVSDETV